MLTYISLISELYNTAHKMKFAIKDLFSKCEETLNG